MALPVYKLVPSAEELTDLEMRVSHILGWKAGTVEIRETIREFRLGRPPVHRYRSKTIDELRQVISPPQGITVQLPALPSSRVSALGGNRNG